MFFVLFSVCNSSCGSVAFNVTVQIVLVYWSDTCLFVLQEDAVKLTEEFLGDINRYLVEVCLVINSCKLVYFCLVDVIILFSFLIDKQSCCWFVGVWCNASLWPHLQYGQNLYYSQLFWDHLIPVHISLACIMLLSVVPRP